MIFVHFSGLLPQTLFAHIATPVQCILAVVATYPYLSDDVVSVYNAAIAGCSCVPSH
jgi:hypothetical protein